MQVPAKLFSEPQICPKHPTAADMSKRWQINFRYFNTETGQWIQFGPKKGINNFKKFKDRLAEAQALREAYRDALENGWNPITGEAPAPDPLDDINEFSNMSFSKAIPFALARCKVSKRTLSNYTNSSTRIMKEANKVTIAGSVRTYSFSEIPICEIKKKHVKILLDHCRGKFKWSNKAFNKHMGYFKSILSRLCDDEIITGNPGYGIKYLPVKDTEKFIPYTEEEKIKLRDYLYMHHYGLYVFLMMIYYTGMRPNEVLALKISDLDIQKQLITVVPDESRDNSKTKSIRTVPLTNDLFALIREWLNHDYKPEYYLFGSPFKEGRGNAGSSTSGRGSMHPDYFKPSPTRIKRDTVTKLWKKQIIDNEKLGVKKHLYAAKHTGGDDKILAGIDLDAIKNLFGHSSKFMTEKYVSKLKDLQNEQVKRLTPAFLATKK